MSGLGESVAALVASGAELLTGGNPVEGDGFRFQNTLLRISGADFVRQPEALQREAFGRVFLVKVLAECSLTDGNDDDNDSGASLFLSQNGRHRYRHRRHRQRHDDVA